MSSRLEMLQVARLAPRVLGEAATKVAEYLESRFHDCGAVMDRAGEPDLYYTVFGLESSIALQREVPAARTAEYLRSFGDGSTLDLVHLASLVRCWASLPDRAIDPDARRAILKRIETHRSADGGYSSQTDSARGTVYHAFLALGLHQDLGSELPDQDGVARSLESLRRPEGGYSNDVSIPIGNAPSTAAALTLLRHFGRPTDQGSARWLFAQCQPEGGFKALPDAPVPDLLSTATALHALSGLHAPIERIQDACLDFLDTLWTGTSFCATWYDDAVDPEYTFYALLALGHLTV